MFEDSSNLLEYYRIISQMADLKNIIIDKESSKHQKSQKILETITKKKEESTQNTNKIKQLIEKINQHPQINLEILSLLKHNILSNINSICSKQSKNITNKLELKQNNNLDNILKLISNQSNFCNEKYLEFVKNVLLKMQDCIDILNIEKDVYLNSTTTISSQTEGQDKILVCTILVNDCIAGTSSPTDQDTDGNGTGCTQCEENTYSEAGATNCIPCTNNRVSEAGSTKVNDCQCPQGTTGPSDEHYSLNPQTYYKKQFDMRSNQYRACPKGTFSQFGIDTDGNGAGCEACDKSTTTVNSKTEGNNKILVCTIHLKDCIAGTSSSTGQDTDGNGTGCTLCEENTYSETGATNCIPCTNNRISEAGSTKVNDCQCPQGTTGPSDGISACQTNTNSKLIQFVISFIFLILLF
ncbi:hypothetical protein ABPG74_019163 [Tetrahymena malaccensis]